MIDGVRRPDGVSLDPSPALPEVGDAASSVDGAASLRTPLGTDAALEVLDAYARAIVAEDAAAMVALHTSDAAFVAAPPGQPPRSFPNAAGIWRRRFERLDYGALAGALVVRTAEARVSEVRGELATYPMAASEDPEAKAKTPLADAELTVKVPVAASRVGAQSLLGSELVLFLRREGDHYRVSAVVEDIALP